MKTTYKVLKTDIGWDGDYVLICSTQGKGNTYIKMNLEELRDFYFSGYMFKATSYSSLSWFNTVAGLNIDNAISVEEQILFK